MATYCSTPSGITAGTALTTDYLGRMWTKANTEFNNSLTALEELANFDVPNFAHSVDFNVAGQIEEYQRVPAPELDETSVEFDADEAPNVPLLDVTYSLATKSAPAFSVATPDFTFATLPSPFGGVEPDLSFEPSPRVVREAPDVTTPDVPVLRQIPELTLSELDLDPIIDEFEDLLVVTGDEPAFNNNYRQDMENSRVQVFALANGYWTEVLESYGLLDNGTNAVMERLNAMVAGGTGLPASVQDAIFQRSTATVDRGNVTAIWEAKRDLSGRDIPSKSGIYYRRVDAIRQSRQDALAQANRDAMLARFQGEQSNIQFAVGQGIAYQGQLQGLMLGMLDWARQAADTAYQIDQAVFSARVAWRQAEAQMRQAAAQVVDAWVRAELSKLEKDRLRLESQRLKSQLNEQDVAIYNTRVSALRNVVDLHNSQLETDRLVINQDVEYLRMLRERANLHGERIRSHNSLYDAARSQNEAEGVKADVYRTQVQAHESRVRAVKDENESQVAAVNAKFQAQRLALDRFRSQLDRFNTLSENEQRRISAVLQRFQTLAGIFGSQIQEASAISNVDVAKYNAEIRRAEVSANVEIEENRNENQNVLQAFQAALAAATEQARLTVGLAQGLYSAIDVGASTSTGFSFSNSSSCSTNFHVDVED